MSGQYISLRSIAFYGAFNPAVVSADWLASVGLVEEKTPTEMTVTTSGGSQAVRIDTDWFRIEVTGGTFFASTAVEDRFDDLVRLVNEVFALLRHTPIDAAACGLEATVPRNEAQSLLARLAPASGWAKVGEPKTRRLVVELVTEPTEPQVTVTVSEGSGSNETTISVVVSGAINEPHIGALQALELLGTILGVYRRGGDRIIRDLLEVD